MSSAIQSPCKGNDFSLLITHYYAIVSETASYCCRMVTVAPAASILALRSMASVALEDEVPLYRGNAPAHRTGWARGALRDRLGAVVIAVTWSR